MAIDPASDIILDVARAADPDRASAVARRLTSLASANGAAAAPADFAAALDQTGPPTSAASPPGATAANMRDRLANIGQAQNDKAKQAQVQFEAVLLNSFVGEMLPKDEPDTYGQGLAGEMWRSMLADQVSRKIASSGALGIGQRLFATHPLAASAALGHAQLPTRASAAAATQMSPNALSASNGADIVEGSFLFRGAKPL